MMEHAALLLLGALCGWALRGYMLLREARRYRTFNTAESVRFILLGVST